MLTIGALDADRSAQNVAGWLGSQRIKRGDRVALAPAKPPVADAAGERTQANVLLLAYGCLRYGVTPVMVNPQLSKSDRAYVLADCRPSQILTETEFEAVLKWDPVPVASEFTARPMHYTSGTTGRSKGVWAGQLPPDVLLDWWRDEAAAWPHESRDTTLVCGPFSHSAPLRFAMLCLAAGGSVLIPGAFSATAAATSLRDDQPSTAFVAPVHLQRLLSLAELPPSTFRMLVHAGSPCPTNLKQRVHTWAQATNVWEFYGSTEGQFTQCRGTEWEARPDTVGKARPHRQLIIDDGVIWCSAPASSAFEYWLDPAKTATAWRTLPNGSPAFTVFDTGELDDAGYLYFSGRRDDLIISGGVNIYPIHVEAGVNTHHGVIDSAAFGMPDEHWGEAVYLVYEGTAEPADVLLHARLTLASYQVPKHILRVPELPRTATGKTRRDALPQLLVP